MPPKVLSEADIENAYRDGYEMGKLYFEAMAKMFRQREAELRHIHADRRAYMNGAIKAIQELCVHLEGESNG